MRRSASASGLLVLAVTAVVAGGSGASASTTAARIIDRTLSCSVPLKAGARPFVISARSGFRDPDTGDWKWLAKAEAGWVPSVWVSAGTFPELPPAALAIDRTNCRAATARVSFSRRGLAGGVASQLMGTRAAGSDAYECRVAATVLIRVRAVFRAPTALTPQRYLRRTYLASPAGAVVSEAQVAVRTPKGKRIMYSDVSESGKGRLFNAPGCRDWD